MGVGALGWVGGFGGDLPVVGLELCSDLGELYVGGVEGVAVGDDLRDIRVELGGCNVLVRP